MNKIALAFMCTALLVSCAPATPTVEPKQSSTKDVSEAKVDHQAFVTKYFDAFNKHDWKALSEMYAQTAQFKDPSLGQDVVAQSREDFVKKYTELSDTFSDVRDDVVAIYPSGDKNVIVEFVSSGTAPDGSKFKLPICTIFTIENGFITKDFTYYDNFEEG